MIRGREAGRYGPVAINSYRYECSMEPDRSQPRAGKTQSILHMPLLLLIFYLHVSLTADT